MASRNSSTSFAKHDAADMLANILGQLPVVPSGELSEAGGTFTQANRDAPSAATKGARRLAKLKRKLDQHNNYMLELKRKIKEKESTKQKVGGSGSGAEQSSLTFLQNQLRAEKEVQRELLDRVIAEQQRGGIDGKQWQSIRLCPDTLDADCSNPWTVGSVPVGEEERFSYDSNLSSLSASGEQVGGNGTMKERFEKELLSRDLVIETLQDRLERLSADVRKVRRDNETILGTHPVPAASVSPGRRFCETDMLHRLEFYRTNTDTLGKNLEEMGQALKHIQKELGAAREERSDEKICPNERSSTSTKRDRSSSCAVGHKSIPSERLEQPRPTDRDEPKQYNLLLQEYTKKSTECRQLSDRLAKAQAGPGEPSPDETERDMLKKRCTELLDEQDQFRVLIREQSTQLEDYRGKYLDAQQTAEEQRLQMDKLRITNKRVETQINYEIEQIRRKFQDKLRELTPYPRLLEEEELKGDQLKQSNQTLFVELERALKQVKTLEDRLADAHAAADTQTQQATQQSALELEQQREKLKQFGKEKQQLEEQSLQGQRDLDEFRAESARIIARANQRLEQERQAAQQRYAKLEGELACCRAEASFTIKNREDALREMHNQIRVLSGSFDDAQLQIRSLRNQLSYLQNEKLVCLA